MREKMLYGRSLVENPDGGVLMAADGGGLSHREPALWAACKEKMLGNIGRTVEELLEGHPARRAALGLAEGQSEAALSLERLLGAPGPAPDQKAPEQQPFV
ncbi:MAG: hypothetical protein AB7C89_04960 [Intestinibacillus sp.]